MFYVTAIIRLGAYVLLGLEIAETLAPLVPRWRPEWTSPGRGAAARKAQQPAAPVAARGRLVLVGHVGETAVVPRVTQMLPPRQYAAFALPEPAAARRLLTDYIDQTWLPQSGCTLTAPLELDHNGRLLVLITP